MNKRQLDQLRRDCEAIVRAELEEFKPTLSHKLDIYLKAIRASADKRITKFDVITDFTIKWTEV